MRHAAEETDQYTFIRLVDMVTRTNLVALDKALSWSRSNQGQMKALENMISIRDKIQKAMAEVGRCL